MPRLMSSEEDSDVTVQPGVKWEDLNAHLKAQGVPLFFPVCPSFHKLCNELILSLILDQVRQSVE